VAVPETEAVRVEVRGAGPEEGLTEGATLRVGARVVVVVVVVVVDVVVVGERVVVVVGAKVVVVEVVVVVDWEQKSNNKPWQDRIPS